jgi:fimbrial chaperone protein
VRAFLLGALLLVTSLVHATDGGFAVSPVRLDLAPGARATSITLSNSGDIEKTVQVEAFRWTQVDGEDRYEPVTDLVVNPPVFKLSPRGRQVIRAGFRGGAPSNGEESAYRLYFQELADDRSAVEGGLRMLLRIGVPLFVAPASTAPAATAWRVIGAGTDDAQLEVSNHGNTHLRLSNVAVHDSAGRIFDLPGFAYVLPGQSRRWTLPRDPAPPLRVAAQSDLGALDAALPDH